MTGGELMCGHCARGSHQAVPTDQHAHCRSAPYTTSHSPAPGKGRISAVGGSFQAVVTSQPESCMSAPHAPSAAPASGKGRFSAVGGSLQQAETDKHKSCRSEPYPPSTAQAPGKGRFNAADGPSQAAADKPGKGRFSAVPPPTVLQLQGQAPGPDRSPKVKDEVKEAEQLMANPFPGALVTVDDDPAGDLLEAEFYSDLLERDRVAMSRSGASRSFVRSMVSEKVFLLRYGGGGGRGACEDLRDALLAGPHFRPCRDALKLAGHTYVHPSGAIVLVKPEQFQDIQDDLECYELHPFHVVITESFECLLEELLGEIPCRRRPREKIKCRQEVGNQESRHAAAKAHREEKPEESVEKGFEELFEERFEERNRPTFFTESLEERFEVKRTFISLAPKTREACTVVQSTTEAINSCSASSTNAFNGQGATSTHYAYRRGRNPRRFLIEDDSG